MQAHQAHQLHAAITAQDMHRFDALLPESARALVRAMGMDGALRLLNGLGGVQLVVPKGPCHNPGGMKLWAYLADIVGDQAMRELSLALGGSVLDIPVLDALRKARRNYALVTAFDRLTATPPKGDGLSKARAVQQLCITHGPITYRTVEQILDGTYIDTAAAQHPLF